MNTTNLVKEPQLVKYNINKDDLNKHLKGQATGVAGRPQQQLRLKKNWQVH